MKVRTLAFALGVFLIADAALPSLATPTALAGSAGRQESPHHAPTLDPEKVHSNWERAFGLSDCEWPTYHVDVSAERGGDGSSERPFSSLAEAVDEANRLSAICGPTISMGEGRYEEGLVRLTKPTIISGEPNVVIVGTIANVSDAPFWLQDLSLENAPFPGAVLASHPKADATLVGVHVRSPTGFGLAQNGGRLEMWSSTVEGSAAPDRWETPPWASEQLLRADQEREPRYSGRTRLGMRLVADFSERDRMGPGVRRIAKRILGQPPNYFPWEFADLVPCFGSGLYLSGGSYSEISDLSTSANARAGLVVRGNGTWASGSGLAAGLNGLSQSIDFFAGDLDSDGCFGGMDVDGGMLLIEDSSAALNVGLGIVGRRAAIVGAAALMVLNTAKDPGDSGFAHNVFAYKSFVSLADNFKLSSAKAGLVLFGSQGNAVDGEVTGHEVGIISTGGSQIYLKNVDYANNVTPLEGSDLPVANQPFPVPESP